MKIYSYIYSENKLTCHILSQYNMHKAFVFDLSVPFLTFMSTLEGNFVGNMNIYTLEKMTEKQKQKFVKFSKLSKLSW